MQSLSHPQGLVVFEASEEKRATPICEVLKSQCETKNAHEIDEALEKIGNVNGSRGDGIYKGERYVLHRFRLHAFTQDLEKQFAASLPFIFAEKNLFLCSHQTQMFDRAPNDQFETALVSISTGNPLCVSLHRFAP